MRRAPRRFGVLVSAAMLTACAAQGAQPATDPPSPTLTALPPELEAARSAFWAAWLAANETSDPQAPGLPEHAANPLLETLRAKLDAARERNHVSRGEVVHHVRGMEVDGDARRVVDCVEIGGWRLYKASTGVQVPDQLTRARSQLTVLVLRQQDGMWKATNMYVYGQC